MWTRSELGSWCRWLALSMLMSSLGGCSEVFPKRAAGEKLYRKHCADCHGIDGSGHTVRSMGDPNANLVDDSWRHPGDAAGMEAVIGQGLVFEHPTFDKLSREEVRQIVDHVLSLRGERRR
jgi:mono/diheme cytochrome c family protein